MKDLQNELQSQLPEIKFHEPLGKYSTFQIGGPADFFYRLKNIEELPYIIDFCRTKKIPTFIFGAGSNILFHDKGFRGFVIKIEADKITFDKKNSRITTDAGVLISKLINESIKNGYSGLEKWIGLPGTVGGAVRGNAGCNGLETKDILVYAHLFDQKTLTVHEANAKYFHFSYRTSRIKESNEIVLSATFQLQKRQITEEEQKQTMHDIRKARAEKQPFGLTTGSFFKNPSPSQPAGMLIEKAGLKGKTIGKAQISTKHGNFFLNIGGATATDIIKLARLAKQRVKAKFGITLEEEVRIVPEKLPKKLAVK